MLHTIPEQKPIAPERTPEAIDFTDRLRLLLYDVRIIDLATGALAEGYSRPA